MPTMFTDFDKIKFSSTEFGDWVRRPTQVYLLKSVFIVLYLFTNIPILKKYSSGQISDMNI